MIGLGVVGCGDVAFRSYLPGLQMVEGRARLVACSDPQLDRARAAAALSNGAEAYGSLDAFLEHPGLDAVVNLTPAPLHRDVNMRALEAGFHVYSEKPLAGTVEEASALIEMAESRDRLLLCAPAVMATARFGWLHGEIQRGRIGTPTLAVGHLATMGPAAWREYTGDPRVFYGPGVGPLLDLGVYILHAVTGLLGPARRVEAFGGIAIPRRPILIDRFEGETIEVSEHDQVVLHLDLGYGVLAQVFASYTVPATRSPGLEVHGSEGTIAVPSGDDWYDDAVPVEIFGNEAGWVKEVPPDPSRYTHLIDGGVPHLVECVEGQAGPVLTAAHARHVLEIMLSAARSAREGRAIELETRF